MSQQTSVKPTSLSCQLNVLKTLYQFGEDRTVAWLFAQLFYLKVLSILDMGAVPSKF